LLLRWRTCAGSSVLNCAASPRPTTATPADDDRATHRIGKHCIGAGGREQARREDRSGRIFRACEREQIGEIPCGVADLPRPIDVIRHSGLRGLVLDLRRPSVTEVESHDRMDHGCGRRRSGKSPKGVTRLFGDGFQIFDERPALLLSQQRADHAIATRPSLERVTGIRIAQQRRVHHERAEGRCGV